MSILNQGYMGSCFIHATLEAIRWANFKKKYKSYKKDKNVKEDSDKLLEAYRTDLDPKQNQILSRMFIYKLIESHGITPFPKAGDTGGYCGEVLDVLNLFGAPLERFDEYPDFKDIKEKLKKENNFNSESFHSYINNL